jgi:hypothetical protein
MITGATETEIIIGHLGQFGSIQTAPYEPGIHMPGAVYIFFHPFISMLPTTAQTNSHFRALCSTSTP